LALHIVGISLGGAGPTNHKPWLLQQFLKEFVHKRLKAYYSSTLPQGLNGMMGSYFKNQIAAMSQNTSSK
jgi:hypothetical protein